MLKAERAVKAKAGRRMSWSVHCRMERSQSRGLVSKRELGTVVVTERWL